MSESDHLTGLTSHAVAMLGNCQLIAGQLERGKKLTQRDAHTLVKCREYINTFLSGGTPNPATIHMAADMVAKSWAIWNEDEADR